MEKKESLQLFESRKVRTLWDAELEKWYISVIDVVEVLTDSVDPKRYWSVLKTRLKQEGCEPTTICSTLKMQAVDGKMRFTDVADVEQLFRLIQSIPSPKAEPFKQWLAQLGRERIEEEKNMLAEASTTEISKKENPQSFDDSKKVAHRGGKVAGVARKELEAQTGQKIVSPLNAKKALKKYN